MSILFPKIYLIGSLRNPIVPELGVELRKLGYEIFDDWFGSGPEADDYWQKYEHQRGRTYKAALAGHAATTIFNLDKHHLESADAAVLVLPAGKSAHMEFGWFAKDKPGFILFDKEPERYEVMYKFATDLCFSRQELIEALKGVL